MFVWATGFDPPRWLQMSDRQSIRPNETGKEAFERENEHPLPQGTFIFWRNV